MGKTIYEMSNAYIKKQELETKRNGNIPDWWGGIATIACNAITDADKELKELRHFKDTIEKLVKNNAVLPLVSDTVCPKCKGQSNGYIHGFRTYCDRCGGTGKLDTN